VAYLGKLKEDQKALESAIAELVIYSDGSVSWSEAWMLSSSEREILIKTVNKYNAAKSGNKQNEFL